MEAMTRMKPANESEFRSRYGPWALIAGASDGIGESFARHLAERGINVILVARREALLDQLAAEIEATHAVETRTIAIDLTRDDLVERIRSEIEGLEIGLLVYNAGGSHDARKFHDLEVDHALGQVRLNCVGPVKLAHLLGRAMRERGRGGILLLSSVASAVGSSYTAIYGATKMFDIVLAEALWHELAPEGVDVMGVILGATRTPSVQAAIENFESFSAAKMEPDEVVVGALANIGKGPTWVAGDFNRQAVKTLRSLPRVTAINALSDAAARLHGLPSTAVEGLEFDEME